MHGQECPCHRRRGGGGYPAVAAGGWFGYLVSMNSCGIPGLKRAAGAGVAALLLTGYAVSCTKTNSTAVDVPEFDGERAFADLVRQVEFGPRVPGSEGHAQCAAWLSEQLRVLADTVWEQPFTGFLPGITDSAPMVNLIGRFRADLSQRILIGAHWDTRPNADRDPDPANHGTPIPGANDGASGVAVLLEIARLMARDSGTPPPIGVDVVFFDGEDAGRYSHDTEWSQGSRYFAERMPSAYLYVIIVDMVGDADLQLYREGYSYQFARPLQDRIWGIARRLGESAFRQEVESPIIDDHLPFLMRGIPAVDIIDLRYPHWHTLADTPDKCSAASLQTVGRVVLHTIYEH